MHIEDIWARRDNGEPVTRDEDDPESYIRHTKIRPVEHRLYHRRIRRPDGRIAKEPGR
jgi:hypothetical protein